MKDYGATGNGTTDDTSAIQSAITAANSSLYPAVFFPPGTYKVSGGGVNLVDGLTLRGAGASVSILRSSSPTADSAIVHGGGTVRNLVEGLGFDGNSQANLRAGVYVTGSGTKKYLRLRDCRFLNCSTKGIDVWTAEAVWIERCEFQDCVAHALWLDGPTGDLYVLANRVTSPANTMRNGITVRAGAPQEGPIRVAHNFVADAASDPGGVGQDGHGINVVDCRGVAIVGNTVQSCVTAGIHIAGDAQDGTAAGNVVAGCAQGIYVENQIGTLDTTIGTAGARRGATLSANICRNCTSYGISVSYSAGTIVEGNVCHDNAADGIVCDSDRCSIVANLAYDNYKSAGAPAQLQKAGIRVYGKRCTLVANNCYDNQTTKTQSYGVAVGNDSHVIVGNQLGSNGTGGLYQTGGGTTNQAANNVTT